MSQVKAYTITYTLKERIIKINIKKMRENSRIRRRGSEILISSKRGGKCTSSNSKRTAWKSPSIKNAAGKV